MLSQEMDLYLSKVILIHTRLLIMKKLDKPSCPKEYHCYKKNTVIYLVEM